MHLSPLRELYKLLHQLYVREKRVSFYGKHDFHCSFLTFLRNIIIPYVICTEVNIGFCKSTIDAQQNKLYLDSHSAITMLTEAPFGHLATSNELQRVFTFQVSRVYRSQKTRNCNSRGVDKAKTARLVTLINYDIT